MRYLKAPILEAALEVRWNAPYSVEQLSSFLKNPAFSGFEDPKHRFQIEFGATIDGEQNPITQRQKQVGLEAHLRDGSQIVILEENRFAFVQRAPYDHWEVFSSRAQSLIHALSESGSLESFQRVGLRFVNRIDIPDHTRKGVNTDDYVTVRFDGPLTDNGIIEEFQMRVVKPSVIDGLHYALVLATTPSPLEDHVSILLDIDVFTLPTHPVSVQELVLTTGRMRDVKNSVFEACITDESRRLFGGAEN